MSALERGEPELRVREASPAAASTGSGLPPGLSAPATRALHGSGIITLAEVAEYSEAELLALHGVGPTAIRTLVAALQQAGLTLRPS
ncbi:hypothetical protein [Haloechinothrix salitolerans]|uniref:DNA-binding protein n=1 Tax=Haloechinothrix salitolerans TaxID=926830 RepID=A0ABW2BYX4_9PSEU